MPATVWAKASVRVLERALGSAPVLALALGPARVQGMEMASGSALARVSAQGWVPAPGHRPIR